MRRAESSAAASFLQGPNGNPTFQSCHETRTGKPCAPARAAVVSKLSRESRRGKQGRHPDRGSVCFWPARLDRGRIDRTMVDQSPSSDRPAHQGLARKRRGPLAILLLTGLAVAAAIFGRQFFAPDSSEELLSAARVALSKKDFAAASHAARALLKHEPDSIAALTIAAEAAVRSGRPVDALQWYERIPDGLGESSVEARIAAGEIYLRQQKQLTEAEDQFRRALSQQPDHLIATDRLSFILSLETRHWEALPYQLAMIRRGDVTLRRLYLICVNELGHTDESIEEYRELAPHDPGVQLAVAERHLAQHETAEAEALLRAAIEARPDWIEPQLKLGRLLLSAGRLDEFVEWDEQLPEGADEFPALWVLRGEFAADQGESFRAAHCFARAVELNGCHRGAVYGLAQALLSLDRRDEAETYLQRAVRLQAYTNAVFDAFTHRPEIDRQRAERASGIAASLGLRWEEHAWSFLAENAAPSRDPQALETWRDSIPEGLSLNRIQPSIAEQLRFDVASLSPSTDVDDSSGSTDHSSAPRDGTRPRTLFEAGRDPASSVSFEDRAAACGIEFRYENGADPEIDGLGRVYEFTGGGVGAVDFDQDGFPDLYFTQGSRSPPVASPADELDRLFRNVSGERFLDVTLKARILEDRYSQGLAVGDVNADGFPDLFVANLGKNRFFVNNGDGTFTENDLSDAEGAPSWTTSCAIADLNRDGLPDIYCVNYLSGDEIFERVCRDRNGIRNPCLPVNFSAAADCLLVNAGDGTFYSATSIGEATRDNGKGLGVLAADIDGSGDISLFVANDGVPNFFLRNTTSKSERSPRFTDNALPAGLALNGDGRSEACMGIAAGDANRDGRLDLFVTNFTEETNTLYIQQAGGLFVDGTKVAGLAQPSYHLLGFGTQFLDVDLDGDLDLIVTNGHIDDYRAAGQMYAMPPQFFLNAGDGRFAEVPALTLGPYFQKHFFGRGLARLDWNQDGREDTAISHLQANSALLTNTTTDVGNYVSLQLRGASSDRDAVGAIATVFVEGVPTVRHLSAGDGYQARNQPLLHFGIGSAQFVDRLIIRWPSGRVDELDEVPVNRMLLAVEGRPKLFRLAPSD
ncbi:MAG: hypothetical protein DWQ29_16205 [Planctomycetota bacterium]|nr:MAG: hypothetical protein DWQ29_16205 [Planctomycetota bacterium]